jgi:hypothetical protein
MCRGREAGLRCAARDLATRGQDLPELAEVNAQLLTAFERTTQAADFGHAGRAERPERTLPIAKISALPSVLGFGYEQTCLHSAHLGISRYTHPPKNHQAEHDEDQESGTEESCSEESRSQGCPREPPPSVLKPIKATDQVRSGRPR